MAITEKGCLAQIPNLKIRNQQENLKNLKVHMIWIQLVKNLNCV